MASLSCRAGEMTLTLKIASLFSSLSHWERAGVRRIRKTVKAYKK
jgi:hypothetical protein